MSEPRDTMSPRTLAGQNEERLLNAFFVLCKTARIVDESNDAFKKQLQNLMEVFQTVAGVRAEVSLKYVSGHYFVNEQMVRFESAGRSGAGDIVDEWRQLGIGGVCIDADIASDELAHFCKFMAGLKPTGRDLTSITSQLADSGLSQVRLLSVDEVDEDKTEITDDQRQRFRQMARGTFFSAMTVVREIVAGARDGQEINAARTKRVVHSLIDHISRDEHSMIELTAIRDFDDYTYAHSTNVAVYALTMGVRMEFDRARLSQLGFSALFHDVGKVKLPQDLIRKPDAFDENDWIQMQRHPLLGAKTILRNLKLDLYAARAARVAFEHHINSDFTGYPALHYSRREPTLFSRIVSIVDTFDALSSGRVYLKRPMGADQVLKKMRFQMSNKFDPFLLKLFNDIIGVYPAGSLILLTSDEIALVLTNNDKDPLRPYVKIVGDRAGLLAEPIWIDLSLPENTDRKVVRQIDPARYGLNIRDFVLDG
ncbi:MAG: HD domain-containing phosphohydrolase [Candidatus Zixiibacteriota bacterium]